MSRKPSMIPATSTSLTSLCVLMGPVPDPEREHDRQDAREDRVDAEPRRQQDDAELRSSAEDEAEQDRQHAGDDQHPLALDDLPQPDAGGDLERAGGHRPCG